MIGEDCLQLGRVGKQLCLRDAEGLQRVGKRSVGRGENGERAGPAQCVDQTGRLDGLHEDGEVAGTDGNIDDGVRLVRHRSRRRCSGRCWWSGRCSGGRVLLVATACRHRQDRRQTGGNQSGRRFRCSHDMYSRFVWG